MKKFKNLYCLVVLLFGFYQLSLAEDIQLNTGTETGECLLPRMDMNASGAVVTCWCNYDFDTEQGQVSMLYVTKKGLPDLAIFSPVDPGWGGTQIVPDVAINENGHFIVIWDENSEENDAIYGRMFYKNKSPKADPFLICQAQAEERVSRPRIAMSHSGDFVVCWFSQREGFSREIYTRLFNQDGSAKGVPFHVNTDTTGSQECPVVDINSTGRFVIAWRDQRSGLFKVYAQRYDENGLALGSNFQVSQHPGQTKDVELPSIAVQENGDFMITWKYADDSDIWHIYASLFDKDGLPKTAMNIVDNSADTDTHWNPDVTSNPNGGYLIAWSRGYAISHISYFVIHARDYDETGTALDDVYRVGEEVAYQYNPCVACDTEGNKVFIWEDTRSWVRRDIYATTFLARKPHLVSVGTDFQELIPISWTLPYGLDINIPYKIYRSTNATGPFSLLSEINIPSRPYPKLMLDYIDGTVDPDIDYYYQVEAVTSESGGPSEAMHGTTSSSGSQINSKWMEQQPVLDGEIQDSEWSEAVKIDIGNPNAYYPVWLYIKNSQDTLYLAVQDENDDNVELLNCLGFMMDQNHNNQWDADPKEGAFRIYNSAIYFTAYTGKYPDTFHSAVPVISTDVRGFASLSNNQLHYEAAVPLADGVLTAEPGDTLWMAFWIEDPGSDYGLFYGNSGEWPPKALWEATETLGHIILAEEPLVGVSQKPAHTQPNQFELSQNYPNPFNPKTAISFYLPQKTSVDLAVYDIQGKFIVNIAKKEMDRGYHHVDFDGSHLPSGVYLYRLKTNKMCITRKMILMK